MGQTHTELRRSTQAGRGPAARRPERQEAHAAEGVLRDLAFVLHLTQRLSQSLTAERTLCAVGQ